MAPNFPDLVERDVQIYCLIVARTDVGGSDSPFALDAGPASISKHSQAMHPDSTSMIRGTAARGGNPCLSDKLLAGRILAWILL